MSAGERRRPSRNQQRRARARQRKTGEPYMVAAQRLGAEITKGRDYLANPAIPEKLTAAIKAWGLIPLEPYQASWEWWCRCSYCGTVIDVHPRGTFDWFSGLLHPEQYHTHVGCLRTRDKFSPASPPANHASHPESGLFIPLGPAAVATGYEWRYRCFRCDKTVKTVAIRLEESLKKHHYQPLLRHVCHENDVHQATQNQRLRTQP